MSNCSGESAQPGQNTRMTSPGPDRTWELVRAELAERVLALANLDDPDRPAAQVLRRRAARDAGFWIHELERTPAPTGRWSRFQRWRWERKARRALRRAQIVKYPEMREEVAASVRFQRRLWDDLEAFRANPTAWLETHSPWSAAELGRVERL